MDGAMGTYLQTKGLSVGQPSVSWNQDHPDLVSQVHREYRGAGAEILLTNTFCGGPKDDIKKGIRLCKEVAGGECLVAGSLGPVGQGIPESIETVAQEGVDLLFLETFYDFNEIKNAVAIAQQTALPIVLSVTLKDQKLISGQSFEDVLSFCEDENILPGLNCMEPKLLLEALTTVLPKIHGPIFLKPNAGQPPFYMDENTFCIWAKQILGLGRFVFGGCCGTTPAHILPLSRLSEGHTADFLRLERK